VLPETLPALLAHLQAHPDVVGLISFGSQRDTSQAVAGDFDLFVVLTQTDPTVRSLHFCLGQVPIDLNLITLDELEQLTPADHFRYVTLRDSTVLHDPLGVITPALAHLRRQLTYHTPALSDHVIATTRHWHRHMLDKVRNRLDVSSSFGAERLYTK